MKTRHVAGALLLLAVVAALLLFTDGQPWAILSDATSRNERASRRDSAADIDARRTPATPPAGVRAEADDAWRGLDFSACDRDLDLHGIVVDNEGRGIAGARVETTSNPFRSVLIARAQDPKVGPSGTTADDGTFALRLRRGELVTLRASHDGFASRSILDCQAGERVRLVLGPAARVDVVARTNSGAPAIHLPISVESGDWEATFDKQEAVTDESGRASFAAIAVGWIRIWANGGGTPFEVRPEGITAELSLTDQELITGSVRDAVTGERIAGAIVGAYSSQDAPVESDSEGHYRFVGAFAAVPELDATAEGYQKCAISDWGDAPVDFALSRGDAVAGRLLGHDGKPVAGAPVLAFAIHHDSGGPSSETRSTISDPDGRFRITSLLRDRPHTLASSANGHGRYLLDFEPGSSPGMIELGDIVLPPARAIEGRAFGADGAPLVRHPVTLTGANADRKRLRSRPDAGAATSRFIGDWERRMTDDLGRFRFPDESPGEYVVATSVDHFPPAEIRIALAQDRDATGVELRVAGGGDLLVTVVGEDGEPIRFASVRIEPAAVEAAQTDADGLALFRGLPIREYSVYVVAEHFESTMIRARPSADEVRVPLVSFAEIRGRVVDEAGNALSGQEVELAGGTEVDAAFDTADPEFSFRTPRGAPVDLSLSGTEWVRETGSLRAVRSPWRGELRGVTPPGRDLVLVAHRVPMESHFDVRVVGVDGLAVPGATVSWALRSARPQSRQIQCDDEGRARIDGVADEEHVLRASRNSTDPGGRPRAGDVVASKLVIARPDGKEVTLALRHARALTIVVVRADGAAAANASIGYATEGFGRMTQTDDAGRLEVVAPEGANCEVVASWSSPEGPTQAGKFEFTESGQTEVRFQLAIESH